LFAHPANDISIAAARTAAKILLSFMEYLP
jgi:hypothetical protein